MLASFIFPCLWPQRTLLFIGSIPVIWALWYSEEHKYHPAWYCWLASVTWTVVRSCTIHRSNNQETCSELAHPENLHKHPKRIVQLRIALALAFRNGSCGCSYRVTFIYVQSVRDQVVILVCITNSSDQRRVDCAESCLAMPVASKPLGDWPQSLEILQHWRKLTSAINTWQVTGFSSRYGWRHGSVFSNNLPYETSSRNIKHCQTLSQSVEADIFRFMDRNFCQAMHLYDEPVLTYGRLTGEY